MKDLFKKFVIFLIMVESKILLNRQKPKIIVVIGSVGKTSTKDAIFAVLSMCKSVCKNKKSLNGEIGIPLTILGLENAWNSIFGWAFNIFKGFFVALFSKKRHEWIVLEVGAQAPGDIKDLSRWIKPNIVVVTAIPDILAHREFFNSDKDVVEEKSHMVRSLKKDGILIIDGDSKYSKYMERYFTGRIITYGIGADNDFSATDIGFIKHRGVVNGISFRINNKEQSIPIERIGVIGSGHIYSTLSAYAVAGAVGIAYNMITKSISIHDSPNGRMKLLRGVNNSLIIDDSYNSSPVAVLSALRALRDLPVVGDKIVALGDMRELGDRSEKEHVKIGKYVAGMADVLIVVGEESRVLAQSAIDAGMNKEDVFVYGYGESALAGKKFRNSLKKEDVILVKGSQNKIRMERFVKEIMAEPERSKELLVRQEKEWLAID